MRLSPGARLGTYEIVAPIGSGGMGEVYRARDTRLKRDVAVKVLSGGWADDPDRRGRFQREAELLAALNHPNIAAIYGVADLDRIQALILELVEGPTLADRLARGPIPLHETLGIGRQIVDALDTAHERGIVHRDLKPANIKVCDDGTVKVLDFGLARTLEPEGTVDAAASPTLTSPALTRMGVMLGTAAYMSPEQARGQAIDKRTDIWAFGCVLYEMLAGRSAFAAATVGDTIAAILEREPDWSALPASTPRSLLQLVRRCLERDRKRRLRDIGDARGQLDEVEGDADRSGTQAAATRMRWPPMLAAAALLASAIAVSVVTWNRGARTETGAQSPDSQFSRVTTDASFSTEPALSRDGTLVVYASDRAGGGQLDLWLQRTAGGQPIRLTDDPADDREPDFSPDGSVIAFRSNRAGGGVYVIPTLGGDARLVAEGGRRPRFSPDGRRIAYWTGPWLTGDGPRGPGSAVFTTPANGGQPARIADDFITARDPVWSPDGRGLLFFGRRSAGASSSGRFDWWWSSLEAGQPLPTGAYQVLTANALLGPQVAGGLPHDALPGAWTTAGVLFSARRAGSVNLWRLTVSERSGQAIAGSLERLTRGAGSDVAASVDGMGRVAFQVATEGEVSLTLPLDANAATVRGSIARRSFEAGNEHRGRNSLDHGGRLLVYPKARANESEIWVKDLMTGEERHLVATPRALLNPIMSPDGTKVAYSVRTPGSAPAGYVVPVPGGKAGKVCDGCSLGAWFADNRRIVAFSHPPDRPVHARVLDVVDGTIKDLVSHPTATIGRVDLSPAGRWLSFSARRSLWIAPVRPGDPPKERDWTQILAVPDGSAERACGWSPDGRLLYLLLERDGFRDLYAQRVDPTHGQPVGDPFVVQHLHDPRLRWGSTPFGTAIASNAFVFNQVEVTGSIWLLDPGPGAGLMGR